MAILSVDPLTGQTVESDAPVPAFPPVGEQPVAADAGGQYTPPAAPVTDFSVNAGASDGAPVLAKGAFAAIRSKLGNPSTGTAPLPDVSKPNWQPTKTKYDEERKVLRFMTKEEEAQEAIAAMAHAPVGGGMGGGGGYGNPLSGVNPSTFGQTPTERQFHGDVYEHMLRQGGFSVMEAANQAAFAEQKAKAEADAALEYAALLDDQRQREKERQAWVNSALDRHEQMANDMARQEIDPDHFFTSKGTAGGIMAGIGMAMAGVGDAMLMASGVSGAARFMERATSLIDRDIAVQKANIQLKRDAFGAQMGVFAERYRAFGDERVAEASARATIFDWLAVQTRAYQARAFDVQSKIAIGQIAEKFQFDADAYRSKIAIASEHAYQDAVAKQQAQIAAARAEEYRRQREWMDYQRKKLFDVAAEGTLHHIKESGGSIGQMPAGSPLAGLPVQMVYGKDGGVIPQLPGNPLPQQGGASGDNPLPPGVKPGSKEAMAYEERMVGGAINGQRVTLLAHNQAQATKLGVALSESERYTSALKRMKDVIKSGIASPRGYKEYSAAFNAIGGSYKQLYDLGAFDLGVQNLVEGTIPAYRWALVDPKHALKIIDQEIQQAAVIRNTAINTWAAPHSAKMAADLSSTDTSDIGAVRRDPEADGGTGIIGTAAKFAGPTALIAAPLVPSAALLGGIAGSGK